MLKKTTSEQTALTNLTDDHSDPPQGLHTSTHRPAPTQKEGMEESRWISWAPRP